VRTFAIASTRISWGFALRVPPPGQARYSHVVALFSSSPETYTFVVVRPDLTLSLAEQNDVTYTETSAGSLKPDEWHRCELDFDGATNTISLTVGGVGRFTGVTTLFRLGSTARLAAGVTFTGAGPTSSVFIDDVRFAESP
jgi:hypothetical protein